MKDRNTRPESEGGGAAAGRPAMGVCPRLLAAGAAATLILLAGCARSVNDYLAEATTNDPEAVREAVIAIGGVLFHKEAGRIPFDKADEKAVLYLKDVAAGSPVPVNRAAAIAALGKVRQAEGGDVFLAGLRDPFWLCRLESARAMELEPAERFAEPLRDALKAETRPEVRINQKFMPEYRIRDCINYLFNSNQPDAMFMEDGDRRCFVHEITSGKLPEALTDKADAWLNGGVANSHKGEGPAILFDHLLHVDLAGFDPRRPAMVTSAKKAMIRASKSELGGWVADLKEDPVGRLKLLGEKPAKECDLFTPTQLLRCFDPEKSRKVSPEGLSRELMRSGIRPANGGRVVRTKAGVVRLIALRNAARWKDVAPKVLAEHFDHYFGPDSGRY